MRARRSSPLRGSSPHIAGRCGIGMVSAVYSTRELVLQRVRLRNEQGDVRNVPAWTLRKMLRGKMISIRKNSCWRVSGMRLESWNRAARDYRHGCVADAGLWSFTRDRRDD